jgi:hypothetical protein
VGVGTDSTSPPADRASGRRAIAERAILVLCLVLLIPAEVICAEASFETVGEITHWMVWMAVVGGNAFVLVLAAVSRPAAIAFALVLGLIIVPYQLVLMRRHAHVQHEAARIVAYAYETRAETGAFPGDLSGYEYERPAVERFIQGYATGADYGGFRVWYRVGTPSTSHWYSPRGGWDYYPD